MLKTEFENTVELIATQEGIHTLHHKSLNEHYHSLHGSLQESMHVFIENGLTSFQSQQQRKGEFKILEMGFGTGLNALLTYRENSSLHKNIHYTTVEAFPLPMNIVKGLNYFEFIEPRLQPLFLKMHACNWFENVIFNPADGFENISASPVGRMGGVFTLYKIQADMLELKLDDSYDLVYYDAFSPTHQPELWTFEVLKKIYDACNEGALLVTYCAKGEVKRTLKNVGFKVEAIKGPKGKREMIRARKMLNFE